MHTFNGLRGERKRERERERENIKSIITSAAGPKEQKRNRKGNSEGGNGVSGLTNNPARCVLKKKRNPGRIA